MDDQAKRFLTDVRRSPIGVLGLRAGDQTIISTVDVHAHDRVGTISAAIHEVAHIYPVVEFEAAR